MFNEIRAWLLSKGVWFLLVLFGLIIYANVQPEWKKSTEVSDARGAQELAHKKFSDWEKDSISAIERAKSETIQFLDKRITAETITIEKLNAKIDSLSSLKISSQIYKKTYVIERDWANWRKNRYEQLRALKSDNDVERQARIAQTNTLLKEKKDIFDKKLQAYDAMPSGIDSGSEKVDGFFSGAIKKVNWAIGWSNYEIKDPNAAHPDLVALSNDIKVLQSQLEALKKPKRIQDIPVPANALNEIDDLVQKASNEISHSWFQTRVIQPASDYWPYALVAVMLGILFSPLSRFICFYFLAPIATRQEPIALEPNSDPRSGTKECSTSGTNIKLDLEPEDILLVHHDYAKTIPKNCRANTQILLDNASPFTSLASGLYNLVKIAPIETTTVDISSGHDGLNELMTIKIEAGESIVIEPRNIVGIVVRQGQVITLRKHWVFNKLQPWLKWQFRYITISGPLTLVLKGGRGLVVSQLRNELLIEPEYVVAFSSSIGYGTSRTETFGGYYSRKKSLLKDHFFGSHGFVIHQEANLDSSTYNKKSGLEGVLDGVLKAFGI